MTDAHNDPSDKLYLTIAATLGSLTIVSYLADLAGLPRGLLVLVVLAVAVVKATLVATFFMHLKVDWTKVKVMLIPAVILAAVLVFALMPDITIANRGKVGWTAGQRYPVVEKAHHESADPSRHAP